VGDAKVMLVGRDGSVKKEFVAIDTELVPDTEFDQLVKVSVPFPPRVGVVPLVMILVFEKLLWFRVGELLRVSIGFGFRFMEPVVVEPDPE